MDLKNNQELHQMLRTFVVLDKDSILSSSDSESTALETDHSSSVSQSPNPKTQADSAHRTPSPFSSCTPSTELKSSVRIIPPGVSRASSLGQSNQKEVNVRVPAGTVPQPKRATLDSYYDDICSQYLQFTNENPTTYHAIGHFADVLSSSLFTRISEKDCFEVDQGLRFFVTRGDQAMVAVVVGKKWVPENGFGIVGAHVDALTAKLKPSSIKDSVDGFHLLGVAAYSGALNHLWLDRDLGIGGSVLVKDRTTNEIHSRVVTSGSHAICRIPSLAPHFGSAAAPLPYNQETKMVPVMGYGTVEPDATADDKLSPLFGKHSLSLLRFIARLAECKVAELVGLDLELFDVQHATRGGLNLEFMFAPRIDDRLCAFSAIHALASLGDVDLQKSSGCHVVLLANNEEIGSGTRTGAKGKLLNSVMERLVLSRGYGLAQVQQAFANSIILSADVTHSLNPNFKDAYLEGHYPLPNTGLTLKKDANGHVMTDLVGVMLMETIASHSGLTMQQFHIRNDMPSGGTIGPMLAMDTGSRVIDVGLPQLSMHSIRATAGFKEPGLGIETFLAFFRLWRRVLDTIEYL